MVQDRVTRRFVPSSRRDHRKASHRARRRSRLRRPLRHASMLQKKQTRLAAAQPRWNKEMHSVMRLRKQSPSRPTSERVEADLRLPLLRQGGRCARRPTFCANGVPQNPPVLLPLLHQNPPSPEAPEGHSRIHNLPLETLRGPLFREIMCRMNAVVRLRSQEKFLRRHCNAYFAPKTTHKGRAFIIAALTFVFLCPTSAGAQVVNFVFTTDSQTIQMGVVSEQITIQAQGAGGTSVNIPLTVCLSLNSTSPQGQFSSNATNWNPISVLTMNKNTANKNFYYKDTQTGTQTLTVKAALKPESENRSCASWPLEEWNMQSTATQSISVGAASPEGSAGPVAATSSNQTTTTSSGQTAVSSYVPPPETELFADGGENRTVIVGADTEFRGRAYNRKKETVDRTRFVWNFGDGSTAEGPTVSHHYDYPGKYAVVLTIANGTNSAGDKIIVVAEQARLAFSILPDGSVSIENMAGRDLDLSRWIVRQLGRDFILPDDSIILAGSSMRISQKTLGFWSGSSAELTYPNGVVALHAGERTGDSTSPPPLVASSKQAISSTPPIAPAGLVEETPIVEPEVIEATKESAHAPAPDEDATTSSQVAAVGSTSNSSLLWWLGALALGVLASGAIVFAKRFGRNEWDIIEEG